MKYLIISDIHANLEALEAVLKEAGSEMLICLGDVIGYGPDPSSCIQLIRAHDILCILGNHDNVQLDPGQLTRFNPLASRSAAITHEALGEEDLFWISTLPEEIIINDLYFTHSSPYDAKQFHYLKPYDTASPYLLLSFSKLAPLGISTAFVGHTHIPGIFSRSAQGAVKYTAMKPGQVFDLEKDCLYIINCPSVGQPRNHHTEAQYAIYDDISNRVEFKSVPYDISLTSEKMRKNGIPEELWKRLAIGT